MSNPTIPSKSELLEMIADRKGDLQNWHKEFDPPWVHSADDKEWRHIRERERKIDRTVIRLGRAKQKLDHDFDLNS